MAEAAPEPRGPEHILCDTSFVSLVYAARLRPERVEHWPAAPRERVERATLAVPVFVLGEIRSGWIQANWGQNRIQRAEAMLSAYLLIPLDFDVVDQYVEIRANHFQQMGDNDMWIAASARAREWPLVTCDKHFCRLKDELDLIYLPRDRDAPQECP